MLTPRIKDDMSVTLIYDPNAPDFYSGIKNLKNMEWKLCAQLIFKPQKGKNSMSFEALIERVFLALKCLSRIHIFPVLIKQKI